ncbi:MAG: acetyl-CoA carboxylase carboxyltransferase subunit alpha [Phycisphaerales bacterium]|nr:acetyl-CoA carboxylase carboxyltransferase subunit alpha [Phycisphaerales bacterium]
MSFFQLDFEKPVLELDRKIESLESLLSRRSADANRPAAANGLLATLNPTVEVPPFAADQAESLDLDESDGAALTDPAAIRARIASLRAEREAKLAQVYTSLSPWNTVRVARVPKRPQTRDYIDMMCKDFCELHGDRRYGDDPAMVVGFARIGSIKVLVVGHHKGRTTQEKIACHFGCAHPEGYRKALAKMKLAEKFGLPIVTFVDTPGAYPGLGAEARGQAEAIAVNLREMSRLRTPIVSIVIGEGGSGGALGIAVADRVAMLEHAWYSVISPEGCAAILWKTANEQTNSAAADALKLTARDNLKLKIIDELIPEPLGGAHRDPKKTAAAIERWVLDRLHELKGINPATLPQQRYERFRRLGSFTEAVA